MLVTEPELVAEAVGVAVGEPETLLESEPVLEGLAPAVRDEVGVFVKDRDKDGVDEEELLGVGVGDPVPVEVGDTLAVRVDVIESLPELLGVNEALAPIERDAVGLRDFVELAESVVEGVPLGVSVGVGVAVGVREALEESVGVAVSLPEAIGVNEALAPMVRDAVSLADVVELADAVDEGVPLGVGVGVGVSEAVGVALEVRTLEARRGLAEPISDALGVLLGVREGLAPMERGDVTEAVQLAVTVSDDELLAVLLAVPVGDSDVEELEDGVSVPVGVPVALFEAVALEESDTLGVMDADAPTVTDAVGDREIEAARVSVLDSVESAVHDGVGDVVPVPETVGVAVVETEVESETVPEREGLAPLVSVAVGVLD